MSKKIYIRVDKPIEVGDLVRCVENADSHKKGDIRKVNQLGADSKVFFYTKGSEDPRWQEFWEPVHKLKVGDRVVFGGKDILTVKELSPDAEQLTVKRGYAEFKLFVTDQFELYQPEKHDPKPVPVSFSTINDTHTLQSAWSKAILEMTRDINRRENMKQAIAEMIVELLDKESEKGLAPNSSLYIANWRELDNTVTATANGNKSVEARLSPDDTWDTLTGVYVALSKATGRKLPDWIYGETR